MKVLLTRCHANNQVRLILVYKHIGVNENSGVDLVCNETKAHIKRSLGCHFQHMNIDVLNWWSPGHVPLEEEKTPTLPRYQKCSDIF